MRRTGSTLLPPTETAPLLTGLDDAPSPPADRDPRCSGLQLGSPQPARVPPPVETLGATKTPSEGLRRHLWRLWRFGHHPTTLLAALLLLNAMWLPYRGLQHDARLYAFELLNQTQNGRYHDELSRCYERAGQFSIFSSLARPLVAAAGVPVAFFLLYLGSKLFQLFAMQRLVLALLPWNGWAMAALCCLTVLSLGYGGLQTFHINEGFLTPRLLSTGLVLLGLERRLRSFPWQAVTCMLAAMLVHPVMGVGGLLVWGLWLLLDYVALPVVALTDRPARRPPTWRIPCAASAERCSPAANLTYRWHSLSRLALWVLLAVCGALACGLLLNRPAGIAVFGELDREWLDHIDDFNWYAIPSRWLVTDWLRVGGTSALLAGWIWWGRGPRQRRLALCVLIVAWLGLIGSLLAERLPYALLFQAQTYRTLWLAQWIALPAAFSLARVAWRKKSWWGSQAAFALLAIFLLPSFSDWCVANLLFALGWCAWQLVNRPEKGAPVPVWRVAWAVACWALVGLASAARSAPGLIPAAVGFRESLDLYFWWRLATRALGPCLTIGIGLWLLIFLAKACRNRRQFQVAALCCALILQSLAFWLPYSPLRQWTGAGEYRTLSMIRSYVEQHWHASPQPPAVFWAGADPGYLWFEVGAKSYFTPCQLAGTMFLRSSALEGRRRAHVVAAVELPATHDRRPPMATWQRQILSDVYRRGDGTLSFDDRYWSELLQESQLDLVVTPYRIEGRFAATNGRDYLYDLRRFRQTNSPGATVAVAGPADDSTDGSPSPRRRP